MLINKRFLFKRNCNIFGKLSGSGSFFSSHEFMQIHFLRQSESTWRWKWNVPPELQGKLTPGCGGSPPGCGPHTFVSWSKGSLASPGACVLWGWLWPPQCFLQLLDRKLKLVCSGINKATSRASSTEQAPKRKGGPGMIEFWGRKRELGFLRRRLCS